MNEYDEFVAFMAERSPSGAKTIQPKYVRSKQLETRGKLLRYGRLDGATQSLLDDSRLVDWGRYLKYKAVTVISNIGQQLIQEGAEDLPMQWIEVAQRRILCHQTCEADSLLAETLRRS